MSGGYPIEENPKARSLISPKVLGVPIGGTVVDGVGTATLVLAYVAVCINPGDDVVAAQRLKNGYPESLMLMADSVTELSSDTAITDIYLVAVDALSAAPANYTGNTACIALADTEANFLAQQQHLYFDSTDDVRRVRITVSPLISTSYQIIKVEGFSYA